MNRLRIVASKLGSFLVVAVVVALSGGCSYSRTTHKSVGDRERTKVGFQSPASERKFEQAVSSRYRNSAGDVVEQKEALNFLFVLRCNKTTVKSEAAYFNDQLKKADSDCNNCISDVEAEAFYSRFR